MDELNVMYTSSDLYAGITGVSLLSLLEKNTKIKRIFIFILSYGITQQNKEKLEKTAAKFKRKIFFVDMTPYVQLLENMGVPLYKSSTLSYMKLFLARYIPEEIARIVYIDSDTYFTGEVSEWLTLDLHGKPCAMSQDCIHKTYKKFIGMTDAVPYFNAGLVVFDLVEWKKQNCEQRIFDHLHNVRSNYPLVEQDLINMAIHDDIYEINIKNNCLSSFLLYEYPFYEKIYGITKDILSKNSFQDGIQHTVMYHFSGNAFGRPWMPGSKHPIVEQYMDCWNRSEWKDLKWQESKLSFPYRLQRFLHYHVPAKLNAWCGYFMQMVFMHKNYNVVRRWRDAHLSGKG